MIATCRRRLLGLGLLLVACSEDHKVSTSEGDAGTDAAIDEEIDAAAEFADCDEESQQAPDSLVCTGLYASLLNNRLDKSVREFTPAAPLWSDGAEKHRWIQLPEGEKIDNSKPNDWVFPVGTKVWKEFRVAGKRIETRLWWKTRSDHWERATYAWNADDSEATYAFGGDIKLKSGETYHLPTGDECDDCHKGQADRVLGFSAVNLGLEDASGITLTDLAKEGLLTKKPALTTLSIGADATGLDTDGVPLAAKVLAILHTNCGLPCHNETPGAKANLTSQNLRLDSTLLDGREPDEGFNVLRTAVNKRAEGVQWTNHPYRILPGDPANSLIYQLMNYRDPSGMGKGQMPPIASRKIDKDAVALLEKWIRLLGDGVEVEDAGMDAGSDAGTDASSTEMDATAVVEIDAGMDAGLVTDTGAEPVDTGVDTGVDSGVDIDAGSDAGLDAGSADAEIDAGVPDPDANLGTDADAPDADEPDAEDPDTGM